MEETETVDAVVVAARAARREDMLKEIDKLAERLIEALVKGQDLTLHLTTRSDKNIVRDRLGHTHLGTGKTTKSLFGKKGIGADKFAKMWQVLALVQRLLMEGKLVTQREAYYTLVQHFTNQNQFNNTVQDVVALMGCPRSSLALCASTSGAIAGCISWKIPGCINEVQVESLGARFILVVEKDAVFTYLCGQRLWDSLPCVLITGCGYPPLSVRSLLKTVDTTLQLPVLGLFDYNPHGLRILLTYKHSSTRMGMEGHAYTVDVKWLGIHYNDIMVDEHSSVPRIDPSSLQPWSDNDERIFAGVRERVELIESPPYLREIRLMSRLKLKAETESLNAGMELDSLENAIIQKVVRKMYF